MQKPTSTVAAPLLTHRICRGAGKDFSSGISVPFQLLSIDTPQKFLTFTLCEIIKHHLIRTAKSLSSDRIHCSSKVLLLLIPNNNKAQCYRQEKERVNSPMCFEGDFPLPNSRKVPILQENCKLVKNRIKFRGQHRSIFPPFNTQTCNKQAFVQQDIASFSNCKAISHSKCGLFHQILIRLR